MWRLVFALPIFPEERTDRCLRQIKGGERVAAVEKIEDQRKPDDFFGHRNIARQVLDPRQIDSNNPRKQGSV